LPEAASVQVAHQRDDGAVNAFTAGNPLSGGGHKQVRKRFFFEKKEAKNFFQFALEHCIGFPSRAS
jgi:hypothetical protein